MKRYLAAIAGIICLSLPVSAADQAPLKDKKERTSYSLGLDLGSRLKAQEVEIDPDIFEKGLRDAFSGAQPAMTEDEVKETLTELQKDLVAKQHQRHKELSEGNKKEGDAFLEANKKKEGVKALPSGLQYKVIAEGKGKSPKDTDMVTVHYQGMLIDGTEFDSSHKRGEPATFPVKGVIKGWTEALQLMKEGSKWQIFIPSELAYGERGAGNVIGPNAVLIFDVELISVKEKAEEKK